MPISSGAIADDSGYRVAERLAAHSTAAEPSAFAARRRRRFRMPPEMHTGCRRQTRRRRCRRRPRATGAVALRSHVVVRSRQAEDRLREALDRGVRQVLILGAGLDTLAFRQPDWARELRIFEIDHPSSQLAKRLRLEAAGIDVPASVGFVPVDLDVDAIDERLVDAGYDVPTPTFISCLGVLPYLEPAPVDAVFRFAARLAPSSEIVATFARPSASGFDRLAERAARAGETWKSRFQPAQLEAHLSACGFSVVSFILPEEAQERYFKDRRDGLRASGHVNTVMAVV